MTGTPLPARPASARHRRARRRTPLAALAMVASMALVVLSAGAAAAEPENLPPVAVDDDFTTLPGVPVSGGALANDSDPEGDEMRAALKVAPGHGSLVLNADGTFTYTPNPGFAGEDSFIYRVEDGTQRPYDEQPTATVTITVEAPNSAPVAVDDSVTGDEDIPFTGNVLSNDSDPDGDPLTLTDHTDPTHGTVVLNADGSFTYTPDANFSGDDSLVYTVADGPGATATATLTLHVSPVNDAPVAVDDAFTTTDDTPIVGNLLDNDSDLEDDALIASLVTAPRLGTIVLNADGSFTYSPTLGHDGTDTFDYQTCDHGRPSLCDNATVTITIGATNQAPVALDDAFTTTAGERVSGNVLTNDSDHEGTRLVTKLVTPASHGRVGLDSSGSFTYAPDAGHTGSDRFDYRACDSGQPQKCDTATVVITINAANQAPTAVDDSLATDEDTALTIAAPGLLDNDSDPEGDALTVSQVDGHSVGAAVTTTHGGTVTVAADGSLSYLPAHDFNGSDTFTYRVGDPDGLEDEATVTVVVSPVADAPVTRAESYDATAGEALDVSDADGVLANDTDPDAVATSQMRVAALAPAGLRAELSDGPSHGTLSLDAAGGFRYTPEAGYAGVDEFSYTATGAGGTSEPQRVRLRVVEAEQPDDSDDDSDQPAPDDDPDSTTNDTAALPDTGGPHQGLLMVALGLVVAGGALMRAKRAR